MCNRRDMSVELNADLAFVCPRCHTDVAARFYGPCESCRATLRTERGGEARDIAVEAYIPKMNVTPNAVASRD